MKEQLSKLVHSPTGLSAVVGIVGFGAGVGLGYILGRRNSRYEVYEPAPRVGLVLNAEDLQTIRDENTSEAEASDEDDEDADEDDEDDVSEESITENETYISAKSFIEEKLRGASVVVEETVVEEPSLPIENIFAGDDDDWNYEEEIAKRTPTAPYVLHKDEFYNEERGFYQSTLTWYEGDKTLSDQEGQPVYNYEEIIGPFKFGHGSGDKDVFYIRNEKLRAEYEILFDPGHFAVEVLGYEIEHDAEVQDVKHSHTPRRFQMD